MNSIPSTQNFNFFDRATEQNFEEVHGRIKRGDIVGIKGKPGEENRQ